VNVEIHELFPAISSEDGGAQAAGKVACLRLARKGCLSASWCWPWIYLPKRIGGGGGVARLNGGKKRCWHKMCSAVYIIST
jgi:hypothetical protein